MKECNHNWIITFIGIRCRKCWKVIQHAHTKDYIIGLEKEIVELKKQIKETVLDIVED